MSDIGEIITGTTPSTENDDYYSNEGIPWVTPTDIDSIVIDRTSKYLSEKGEQVARVVPPNTILVTCIASIGKNALLKEKGSFNQQINGLIPSTQCDPYFLLTESTLWSFFMKKMAASGTMQIVNKSEFSNIKTMIPNLKEQKLIGIFFQSFDDMITLHQRKLSDIVEQKLFSNMILARSNLKILQNKPFSFT